MLMTLVPYASCRFGFLKSSLFIWSTLSLTANQTRQVKSSTFKCAELFTTVMSWMSSIINRSWSFTEVIMPKTLDVCFGFTFWIKVIADKCHKCFWRFCCCPFFIVRLILTFYISHKIVNFPFSQYPNTIFCLAKSVL